MLPPAAIHLEQRMNADGGLQHHGHHLDHHRTQSRPTRDPRFPHRPAVRSPGKNQTRSCDVALRMPYILAGWAELTVSRDRPVFIFSFVAGGPQARERFAAWQRVSKCVRGSSWFFRALIYRRIDALNIMSSRNRYSNESLFPWPLRPLLLAICIIPTTPRSRNFLRPSVRRRRVSP